MQERLAKPMDLLLGRKTFAAWETYWPTHSNFWPNVMTATKYVASNTRGSSDWQPNVFLSGHIAEKVRELKQQDGPDIYVIGRADLLQTLFKNDLVDETQLMITRITLGTGKRLFTDGTIPTSFKVTKSQISPKRQHRHDLQTRRRPKNRSTSDRRERLKDQAVHHLARSRHKA